MVAMLTHGNQGVSAAAHLPQFLFSLCTFRKHPHTHTYSVKASYLRGKVFYFTEICSDADGAWLHLVPWCCSCNQSSECYIICMNTAYCAVVCSGEQEGIMCRFQVVMDMLFSPQGLQVKADYVPLLQSLATYGWRLTCVLPTPVIKTNR